LAPRLHNPSSMTI